MCGMSLHEIKVSFRDVRTSEHHELKSSHLHELKVWSNLHELLDMHVTEYHELNMSSIILRSSSHFGIHELIQSVTDQIFTNYSTCHWITRTQYVMYNPQELKHPWTHSVSEWSRWLLLSRTHKHLSQFIGTNSMCHFIIHDSNESVNDL